MKIHLIVLAGLLLSAPNDLRGGCCPHETSEQTYRKAHGIGEYRVESTQAYRDTQGKIRSTYRLGLNTTLKGDCPPQLEWDLPGGLLGDEFESSSLNPGWRPGEDHILHLQDDGNWTPMPFRSIRNAGTPVEREARRDFVRNGARGKEPAAKTLQNPLTDSAQGSSGVPGSRITTTGYNETNGVPSRFTTCDSGTPIPCLVDIDATKLPTGVTAAGALQIVQNALAAWSAASSLKFTIEASVSFGMGADTIAASDRKLRIQLHDSYNRISNTSTLGIGGGGWTIDPGSGATIAGRTFNRRSYSYVVLNHRSSSMANATNFAEVLTHELGHALGLAHSSESSTESDTTLKNATMYYMLSADGRGAAIKIYDEDRIAFGYPFNTPPVSLDRTLYFVSGSPQPTGLGVDRVSLNLFDLQSPPDSLVVNLIPAAGFSLSGNTLIYTTGVTSASPLSDADIEAGTYYKLARFQVSDGLNLSPTHKLVITGFAYDSTPSDGLPDSWMTTYFGTTTPGAAGSPRHPDSDPDGDGLTNRQERYLGTDPIDTSSGLPKPAFDQANARLSFTPLRYVPHEIESSHDLITWTKRAQVGTFAAPVTTAIDVTEAPGTPSMMYRLKVTP